MKRSLFLTKDNTKDKSRNMSQSLMQTDTLLSLAMAEIAVCPYRACLTRRKLHLDMLAGMAFQKTRTDCQYEQNGQSYALMGLTVA